MLRGSAAAVIVSVCIYPKEPCTCMQQQWLDTTICLGQV